MPIKPSAGLKDGKPMASPPLLAGREDFITMTTARNATGYCPLWGPKATTEDLAIHASVTLSHPPTSLDAAGGIFEFIPGSSTLTPELEERASFLVKLLGHLTKAAERAAPPEEEEKRSRAPGAVEDQRRILENLRESHSPAPTPVETETRKRKAAEGPPWDPPPKRGGIITHRPPRQERRAWNSQVS